MTDLPGGAMATRPVHFFWLLDTSGSMGMGGRIAQLNFAIREALPEMRSIAKENAKAQLLVRALTFSTGANWHTPSPTPIDQFEWSDVVADGVTDMGKAFRLAAEQLQIPPMPSRALPPVLALVSDGQPTDDYKSGLQALEESAWGRRAVRVAIAIGDDTDTDRDDVLQQFLRNPELKPYLAKNAARLKDAIRWASTVVVKAASELRGASAASDDRGEPVAIPTVAPPSDPDDDEGDVW